MNTKIVDCGPESTTQFGCQIQRGWVYEVHAEDEAAWTCEVVLGTDEFGSEHTESVRYGYFGNDVPPCGAAYLHQDGERLLVISSEEDASEIPTVEGFTLKPVELEQGDHFHDGTWSFSVIRVNSDSETTIAGYC
jgi:hypothetical protein